MMDDKTSIADAILGHLQGTLVGVNNLTIDSDLIGGGLLDSLNIVRLIQFIEQQFDLQIEDDDIEPALFSSVNHLADYVLMRRNK